MGLFSPNSAVLARQQLGQLQDTIILGAIGGNKDGTRIAPIAHGGLWILGAIKYFSAQYQRRAHVCRANIVGFKGSDRLFN